MNCSSTLLHDIVGGSHESLMKGNCPETVPFYLFKERKVTEQIMKLYEIGYCTPEIEHIVNIDFYEGKSKTANIPEMFLRDKIIVPIKDDCGKLVSFATRSIGKGQSWWNSPFTKGNHLFGLNLARSKVFKENKLYVVEGYFDQCILFQTGLYNVVATMGVKFTMVHAGLALRYCDQLCFCFDADPKKDGKQGAGQKAAEKACETANKYFRVTMIKLPTKLDPRTKEELGIDPDEYVINNTLSNLLALETDAKIEGEKQWKSVV